MHRKIALLASAVGIAAFTAGCGDTSNVAGPIAGPSAAKSTTSSGIVQLPIIRRLAPLTKDYSVSATVGLLGGTILIPQAGLTVVIPPLALKKSTKITVTAPKGSLVVYNFEPHGLTFALPVTMLQLTSLTNAGGNLNLLSTLTGGYLPNGQADINASGVGSFTQLFKSTLLPGGLSVGPISIFTTRHFSGYAWASGRTDDDAGFESTNEDDPDAMPGRRSQ